MKNLKELHVYDDGEIYEGIKGTKFYLAVRFLDDADVSKASVFKWVGEDAPTASDSLIKFTRGWDFFTTFELTYTDEGEIDWESYDMDLEDAIGFRKVKENETNH